LPPQVFLQIYYIFIYTKLLQAAALSGGL
jgi:hypothetical protein